MSDAFDRLDELIREINHNGFQNLNPLDVVIALKGARETIERLEAGKEATQLTSDVYQAALYEVRTIVLSAVGLPSIQSQRQMEG